MRFKFTNNPAKYVVVPPFSALERTGQILYTYHSTSNPICIKPGRKPHFDAVQFTAHLSGQCALKVYQCPGEVCRLYTIFCSGTGQIYVEPIYALVIKV